MGEGKRRREAGLGPKGPFVRRTPDPARKGVASFTPELWARICTVSGLPERILSACEREDGYEAVESELIEAFGVVPEGCRRYVSPLN